MRTRRMSGKKDAKTAFYSDLMAGKIEKAESELIKIQLRCGKHRERETLGLGA